MKNRLFAVPFAVLLSASMVHGQNQESAVEGLGLRTCSELVASKTENPELYRGYAIWLTGFLSAANAYEDDTYDLTPWQPVEMSIAQITKYCAANPDRRMAHAVAAYLSYLRKDRLREPSKLVSVRNGQNAIYIYEEVLARVRTRLRDGGYLGPSDGETFDKAFGEAVLAYQRKNGISPTGLPDTATLLRLLR